MHSLIAAAAAMAVAREEALVAVAAEEKVLAKTEEARVAKVAALMAAGAWVAVRKVEARAAVAHVGAACLEVVRVDEEEARVEEVRLVVVHTEVVRLVAHWVATQALASVGVLAASRAASRIQPCGIVHCS